MACLAALLRALGLRAGSFTSPHLLRYNERIRVDGADAGDAELVAAFEAIEAARGDITLTFFEFNALAALQVFRTRAVDSRAWVGLGGPWSGQIVDARRHRCRRAGSSDWWARHRGIGRRRTGIPAGHGVIADPHRARWRRRRAASVRAHGGRGATLDARDGHRLAQTEGCAQAGGAGCCRSGSCEIGSAGHLQAWVARAEHARGGARMTGLSLPGRFQIVPGQVEWIFDVAHNEAAAQTLAHNLAGRPCAGRTLCVTSMLADKDIAAVARALALQVDAWFVCGIRAPRGLEAAALAARSPVFADAVQCEDIPAGLRTAAAAARAGDRIVVCGSFLAALQRWNSWALHRLYWRP